MQPRRPPPRTVTIRISNATLIVLIICLTLILLGLVLWFRADRTLRAVQQEDPRAKLTSQPVSARPTLQVSPAPSAAPTVAATAADPAAEPTDAPTAEPTADLVPTDEPDVTRAPTADLAAQQPFTLLLLGVDSRPDETDGARSDTLILVRVNPAERWATLLSIPRDTVAQIPGYGLAKVNAAYAIGYNNAVARYGKGTEPSAGGAALAAETLENLLGISVDYTAQVDFRGFAELVDAVGGVLVDVRRPLLDAEYPTEDYGVRRLYIPAGLQVMDGRTALAFARTRHASNDFDRGQRQQQVLRALLDEVRSRGLLENTGLIDQLLVVAERNVRTTLPVRDVRAVAALVDLGRKLPPERVVQYSINPDTVVLEAEDGSDLYWNRQSLRALVRQWQGGLPDATAR